MKSIKIGISQGDINGIGYEVIIKTLMDSRILEVCTPVVYGSPKVVAYHRKALNLENFSLNQVRTAEEAGPKKASIINCLDDNVRVELGKSTELAGEASIRALERAVTDLMAKKIDVLVTAPINKENVQSEKFAFPGHTEYLQKKFGVQNALMMMICESVRIGFVTGHIPLAKVQPLITLESIQKKLRILNRSLIEDFGVRKPRIAVLALNPHAGDNGLLGKDEQAAIIPAVQKAKEENILCFGPFAADGFFGSANYKKFDAILAMYHDQGLIPFKTLFFENGVNYTAGLPFIRTSPVHGTAYDLVGKNVASPDSFRYAMYMACDIYKNRVQYSELTKNPLPNFEISGQQKES